MGSKNTPNGGKLLLEINRLWKNDIKVHIEYGWTYPNYPSAITIELRPTQEKTLSSNILQVFAPWYALEYIKTSNREYTDGTKWAHTFIRFKRVWT